MTFKEYEKRLQDAREADVKSLNEFNQSMNNIVLMLATKPRKWLDEHKAEILGSFIDWWDGMVADSTKFKEEWNAILSK